MAQWCNVWALSFVSVVYFFLFIPVYMRKYLLFFLLSALVLPAAGQDSTYYLQAIKGSDTMIFMPGSKLRVNYMMSRGLRDITTRLDRLDTSGITVEGFQGRIIVIPVDSIVDIKHRSGAAPWLYAGGSVVIGIGALTALVGALSPNNEDTESAGLAMMAVGGGMIGGGVVAQSSGRHRWISRKDGWVFSVLRGVKTEE
jgi:hypothetical protein